MRRAILVILALATLGLAMWALMPRAVEVEVATVAARTINVTIAGEGKSEIREVFTVSAPIAGRMQRISLHAGDAVMAEDTVALLGPVAPALLDARSRAVAEAGLAAAAAAVELAKAQLAQAEAALAFRMTEADRSIALFDRGAIPRHQLDFVLLERDTAAAMVDSARATAAMRERERDSAAAVLDPFGIGGEQTCCVPVTAPVSGRVLQVLTEDDQIVEPGTPILVIGDPGDLVLRVDLLSRDAVRVRPGAAARITGWGGPDLAAEVEQVEPTAVTRTSALGIDEQRVEVLLRLTGDRKDWQALAHGYRVVAQISVLTVQDALAIPIGALFRDGADWATFVVRGNRAEIQPIVLGERDDIHAQVLGGLHPGDQVILHPSDRVLNGTHVTATGDL